MVRILERAFLLDTTAATVRLKERSFLAGALGVLLL
jgi:hypothetical protein